MPDPSKAEAAAALKSAVDTCLWVRLSGDEIRAIVTAHLIEKGR